MHRIAFLSLAIMLPLAAQHETKDDKPKHPFLGDPEAIEAGRKLFAGGCAACHGGEGQGGRGPNLRERIYWHPVDEDTLYKVIQKGIPAGGMPAAQLNEDQTWQVVAFVRSLTAPAIETVVPGDPAAGEALFWGKAGCGECHSIRGKGGKLGPDLTNAGSTRPLPQLRQDILDPDADGLRVIEASRWCCAAAQHSQASPATGRTIHSNCRMRNGHLHLLSMADVREITLRKGSPMPKDYATRLSTTELDDILAYLSRQSARPIEIKKK